MAETHKLRARTGGVWVRVACVHFEVPDWDSRWKASWFWNGVTCTNCRRLAPKHWWEKWETEG